MLVLTRRIGEEIVIDGRIRITIVDVKGERVRVGIAAPPEVAVDRAEVHERRAEFADSDRPMLVPAPLSSRIVEPIGTEAR